MKIKTTLITEVIHDDGEGTTLERTTVSTHGDNPRFHRGEVAGALRVAVAEFIEANTLTGTRPL